MKRLAPIPHRSDSSEPLGGHSARRQPSRGRRAAALPTPTSAPGRPRPGLTPRSTTRGDEGLTLIEMVVTALLLAVVLVPLGRVFSTGIAAASASGTRQDAAELAASLLAKLEAAPYADLGFSASGLQAAVTSQPDYATASESGDGSAYSWQGKTLVELAAGASSPVFTLGANGVGFAPIMSAVHEGLGTFTLTTHIAYGSAYVPACPGSSPPVTTLQQAYVHVYVLLSWVDSGANSFAVDTILYPGGLGQYDGPSAQPSLDPAPPANLTASATTVTGEVKVSWTVPASWVPGECFAVGWANASQQAGSTGLLSASALGTVTAGATVQYTVSGLAQAAEYVLYVTAYAADGVESSQSTDSSTIQSPTGPLVRSVSTSPGGPPGPAAYGPASGGTTVTISGSGFALSGGTLVDFGAVPASSVSCASTTTCTATAPPGTDTVDVTAETPTGPGFSEISSPTLIGDQFTYEPAVLSVSPSSGSRAGGTAVTITGENFVVGHTTFTFGTSGTTVTGTCTSTTSCTATAPAETSSEESLALPVDIIATTAGGSSAVSTTDQFSYS